MRSTLHSLSCERFEAILAFCLDLGLYIEYGVMSSEIYDKRDDLHFNIVNFPYLDGDVPKTASYGVYISQHIRFSRTC